MAKRMLGAEILSGRVVSSRALKSLSVLSVISVVLFLSRLGQAQERQAQLSWWDRSPQQQVGHYTIKADLPPDEARHIAKHLNIMYDAYTHRLASLRIRVDEHMNVYAFQSRQDYLITLRARFGVNAAGSGGMFFTTSAGSGLAFWTEGLPIRRVEHVIQHEGFHQFASSRFGDDLPIWVNEGLAEFFGEGVVVDGTLVLGQSTPRVIDTVKEAIELNTTIPFPTMLAMSNKQWGNALQDGSAALQYHQAWSMVHFLVHGDDGKYVAPFEKYLKMLANAHPSEDAFKQCFGEDIGPFEERWKKYAAAARPSAFVSALERLEFLAEGALELARQKKYPATFDELKTMLREIGFSHEISTHGVATKLSAADDAIFTIPMDDLCPAQPAFTLAPPKLTGLTRRQRHLEDQNPTPPNIGTENLKPRGLAVKWIRDDKANTFRYELDVK